MILPVGPAGTIPEAVNKNAESLTPLTVEMHYMKTNLPQACGIALLALSGLMLAGCEANGDGTIDGGGGLNTGDGDDNGNGTIDPNEFPNNGTVPTEVTDNGTPITGRFICTASASGTGVTTDTTLNGLVGGLLTPLLDLLGGNTATRLLNSVVEPNLLIDGKLSTHATFTLTAGLLGPLLSTIDQNVHAATGATVPAGGYAVFAVGLPVGTVDLSLLNQITVSTSRNGNVQDTNTYTQNDLNLLGLGTHGRAFIGVKATQAYDTATIRLAPGLLTVNVGEALYVHELCTGGRFVAAP